MPKLFSSVKWVIPGGIVLGLFGGVVAVLLLLTQHQPHLPPCEAMRPYLLYQGTYYYESEGANLPSSERGTLVTTIGDGSTQAHSCLGTGAAVYSVKGYPITTELALDTGEGLRVFEVPPATPTPPASTSSLSAAASEATSLDHHDAPLGLLSRPVDG